MAAAPSRCGWKKVPTKEASNRSAMPCSTSSPARSVWRASKLICPASRNEADVPDGPSWLALALGDANAPSSPPVLRAALLFAAAAGKKAAAARC